jgi:hypothetical protein
MKKLLTLLALALFMVGFANAQVQAGQGAIAGVVSDPSKASIAGAKVDLDNKAIGYHKEVVTGANGQYSFAPLTVIEGYSLTISAKGFSTAIVDSFATSVGTVITHNVSLAVGAEGTTVEVAGGTVEQVQTDTQSVSQLIDKQIWEESPLSVRDSNSFVGLVAGAAPDSAGTGRGFAVNGARTGTGNFQVEGADNNDQGLGGAGIVTISPDAIQEYRVITSVPNAEYGRAGGFSTDTVLRSGQKTWHGSAFEYNRIQALAQNSWFSNHNGLRDHLVRNQFGGSIGGPIYKDRTFFYATAEFQRQRSGNPSSYTGITQDFYNFVNTGAYEKWMEGTAQQNAVVITDPTSNSNPALYDQYHGTGFCPTFLGSTCPGGFSGAATLGPIFKNHYNANPAYYPFASVNPTNIPTDLLLGVGNIVGDPTHGQPNIGFYLPVNIYATGNIIDTAVLNQNRGAIKIDHKLTNKDQLAFTYLLDLSNTTAKYDGGEGFPGPPELQVGGAQLFTARWTHSFTSNLLSDFKAGYTRHVSNFASGAPFGVASIFVADSANTGFGAAGGLPQLFTENEFTYEEAMSYTHKSHNFKGGFRFIRTRNGSSFYNDVNGTIGYWGSPGLLTDANNEINGETLLDGGNVYTPGVTYQGSYGALYALSASQDPTTGGAPDPYRGYRANEFSAYAQDDWKITSKLLLSYGLRWEYFGPPHNFRGGVDSNVYFGSATTSTLTNAFAPQTALLAQEQGALFKCVGFNPCGSLNPASAAYGPASGMSTIWDRDLNNFGPRVGFSYDVFGNGKLAVRGGFGIGYDRLYNNVYENIRFNGPHFVDNTAGFGEGAAAIPFSLAQAVQTPTFTGNALLSGASPVPRHVNQHLKTAYYENIHFGVEADLHHGYIVEANYIGNLGRQLVGLENINTFEGRVACSSATQKTACTAAGLTAAQMSTARPNSRFGNDNFRTNGFSSNYSAGQVSLRKGYSNGLQFSANYTYGKAMDQTSDVFTIKSGGTGINNEYFPSRSYGPADFDVRHLATITANYQTHSERHKLLLAGWGISPILQMHSGTPIYTRDSASTYDPNKDGTTGTEPIVYSGPGHPSNVLNHRNSPNGVDGVSGSGVFSNQYYKPYVCPLQVNSGLFCDVPGDRQSLYGLRQYNLDAAISKHIAIKGRLSLTLQAAFFDVDGHVEWTNPVGDFNSISFGKSVSTSTTSGNPGREGQLSGRIDF